MNIFAKNYDIEGDDSLMPERGAARFFAIFFTHFWKLIGVNILFVLFSLPVVTLPASLCAMNRVMIKLIREGNVMLWQEFREEFKADVLSAFLPGLLFAALTFGAFFFVSAAFANAAYPSWCLAFWAAAILLALAGVCIGEYYFVMKAELALSGGALMKNAVLLFFVSPLISLASFAVVIIAMFASIALLPMSLFYVLFAFPALTQYIVCFLINNVIQKRIIGPYEEMNSEHTKSEGETEL